ncbi:ABC transporter B family-like [Raphidocelis subcapitata]|uniref:ABC transporter B family-like n=1 Tax=Raphidocelis subcapitata TaxID=307507 RepID=A0A2V0PA44_9CHLO|nr:ABC transporter B family-like [Raphidocelis subcapitata]|eukprot:GBF96721.1 ABC transporter B family-like [Raphidocelis subcapitata]
MDFLRGRSRSKRQPPILGGDPPKAGKGGGDAAAPAAAAAQDAAAAAAALPTSFFHLFSNADRLDWLLVTLGTVGALGHGAALPMFSLFFGDFTDAFGRFLPPCSPLARAAAAAGLPLPPGLVGVGEFRALIQGIALKFLYLAAGAAVMAALQQGCWQLTGVRQSNRLRARYLAAVLRQEVAFFDVQATTGGLLQGLNEDALAVQQAVSEKAGTFLQHLATFLAGYALAFAKGWDVTLVLVGCLPFLAGAAGLLAKVATGSSTKAQEAYSEAGAVTQQAISQIRTVAAFGGEGAAVARYDGLLDAPQRLGVRMGLTTGLSVGGMQFVVFSSYALALWYGAHRVAAGAYTGGEVVSVIIASLIGSFSLGLGAPVLQNFTKGQAAAGRLRAVRDRAPAIDAAAPGLEPAGGARGEIELRRVAFAYPARPDAPVMADFSLRVPAGKTVALVGGSGSGKSTVIALIERFYDPASGAVLFDGADVRTLSLAWLRQQIGLVSQEPTLFMTTIFENIAIGKPGATPEEVAAAARAANAAGFIAALPLGMETQVGERGVQLSGGQKQRIAIARAVLKNPKVLLLDEATSALDAESEAVVQAALDAAAVGRTTVLVAHRLSTVRGADAIAVVESRRRSIELARLSSSNASTGAARAARSSDGGGAEAGGAARAVVVAAAAGGGKPGAAAPPAAGRRFGGALRWRRGGAAAAPDAEAPSEAAAARAGAPDAAAGKPGEFGRLLALNRPELPWAALGCAASAVVGGIQPAFAFVLTTMITAFYAPSAEEVKRQASQYAWYFWAIAWGILFASILQQWSFAAMGQALARRVRVLLFGAILRQDVGWFDRQENSSGRLATLLSTDAAYIRGAVGDVFGAVIQNGAVLAAGYGIALAYNWRMALLVTGAGPFIAIGGLLQMKHTIRATSAGDKFYAEANQAVTEAVASIRVIHAYNLQAYVAQSYGRLLRAVDALSRKSAAVGGGALAYSAFAMFGIYSLITWFGGEEVASCRSSFDAFFKAFMAVLFCAMSLGQVQMAFPDLARARAAAGRVFPILDRVPPIDSAAPGGAVVEGPRGAVELRGVTFVYPSRPGVTVLSNFSLKVPSGKTVALVGESGSGKSTVIALIERFYDPASGAVLFDGADVRTLSLAWLRQQIGLVSQEPLLFAGSVADNIRYGRPGASDAEVAAAAAAANAAGFVASLPEGYATPVGERGVQLSGGQKQRIAIARAVLRSPRVLLLDEATSALDAESEAVVQAALDAASVGRTTVVVAHRLSTVRNADSIAVVHRGVLLEQGSHSELLALGGGYARLVAAQGGGGGGGGGAANAAA